MAVWQTAGETIMPLLNGARTQVRIWSAYSRLNATDHSQRWRAIAALCEIGPSALPCLRFASGPLRPPRIQYAAAVALHRLGDPAGLEILNNALRWQLPARPELNNDLQWAYFRVGAPDAVTALIAIFPLLPPRNPTVLQFVANVWAAMRDARALEILASPSWPAPDMFIHAIADFGEMAIPHLVLMAAEPLSSRRRLALRGLYQIACEESFTAMRRLLYDPDPTVRQDAPAAISFVNPMAASRAIATAIMDGYSTREAVELLNDTAPTVYEPLLALVERWQPTQPDQIDLQNDTQEAVLAALPRLGAGPIPNERLIPALCALLEREPGPVMTAAIARIVAARHRPGGPHTARLHAVLTNCLVETDKEVRQEAGDALLRMGDTHGADLNKWLEDCWPRENLLGRIHSILRGGPDAGQAASHAVQQVSQWFTRLSREAADRLSTGRHPLDASDSSDYHPRLPNTLRRLLRNAFGELEACSDGAEMEELLSLSTAVVGCLERLSQPDLADAYEELMQALTTVKYESPEVGAEFGSAGTTTRHLLEAVSYERLGSLSTTPVPREVGEAVRAAAASLLLRIYGTESYGLFLCALYSPQPEVHRTAIQALGRLGDARALPYLTEIARDVNRPDSATAHEAINTIRKINPDVMVLLRGSQQTDTRPDTLLRPASGNMDSSHPDILLRPTARCPADVTQQPKPNVAGGASNSR